MPLRPDTSSLVIVDVQARLAPAVAGAVAALACTEALVQAAKEAGVPVLASEQYPKGLGRTLARLARHLAAGEVIEKISFSCLGEAHFAARLAALGRAQVVIAGMEAHVCVLQTALDLAAAGYETAAVADAVGSRDPADKETALGRLARAGIAILSSREVIAAWRAGSGGLPRGRSGSPGHRPVV